MKPQFQDDSLSPKSGGAAKRSGSGKSKRSKSKKNEGGEGEGLQAKSYYPYHDHKDLKIRNCSICKLQVDHPERFSAKELTNIDHYQEESKTFGDLVEYILPPSLDLEGCEIMFPDSVFFGTDGKPAFVAKTEQGKMTSIT